VTDAAAKELPARMEVTEAAEDSAFRTPHSALSLAIVVDDTAAAYPIRIDPTFSDANWISMGGVPGTDSTVRAAVVDGAAHLYIGGANYIAKWDGSSWHALGAGVDFTVGALAVLGSDLYVGGDFKTAGGKVSPYLARAVSGESPTPIPLQWQLQNQRLVLSWTDADFQLQAAPEATGTYTNVPNATSPYTNPLTGPRRFFRLHAP